MLSGATGDLLKSWEAGRLAPAQEPDLFRTLIADGLLRQLSPQQQARIQTRIRQDPGLLHASIGAGSPGFMGKRRKQQLITKGQSQSRTASIDAELADAKSVLPPDRPPEASQPESQAGLKTGQVRAIQALLTGASVKEAARQVHVGRTTVYRWLQDPAFREAYQAAKASAQASTVPQLRYLAAKALQVLDTLLDDSETPALAKVEAAKAVLDYAKRRERPATGQSVSG
jgi:transposase-like protein